MGVVCPHGRKLCGGYPAPHACSCRGGMGWLRLPGNAEQAPGTILALF